MFAMVMDGTLYFAVDEALRETYRRMGSRCFSYNTKKGRVEVTRFWEVPADLIEDSERLTGWARQSVDAAMRSSSPTRKRKRSQ